ncbi:MAG: hypothetical protein IPQ25_19030 [Chitinophagaceae bacterium]|nr:hypothetical protein [Chitinophagaceae bacterium]
MNKSKEVRRESSDCESGQEITEPDTVCMGKWGALSASGGKIKENNNIKNHSLPECLE